MNQNINQEPAHNQQFSAMGMSNSAPVAVKRVDVKKYLKISVGSLVFGVGLYIVLSIVALIFVLIGNAIGGFPDFLVSLGVGLMYFLMLISMIGVVVFVISTFVFHFMLIYKMWAAIDDGQSWTTPGKAIGFLFIPFLGFFYAIWDWTKYPAEYNNYVARHGLNVAPLSSGVFYLYGIISVIPFVGFIAPLILPFVMKQGFGAINNLADAIENPSGANVYQQNLNPGIPHNPQPNLANS